MTRSRNERLNQLLNDLSEDADRLRYRIPEEEDDDQIPNSDFFDLYNDLRKNFLRLQQYVTMAARQRKVRDAASR